MHQVPASTVVTLSSVGTGYAPPALEMGDLVSESVPITDVHPGTEQQIAVVQHVARVPDSPAMKPMPVADSILWSPAVGGAHRPAPLMFFAQPTLRKIQERLAALPNGLGVGLLIGRRCLDSDSGAQFLVIDGALPLPVLAGEDEAANALAEGARSAGIDVVGWYRSHSFSDAALTASDLDAQSELFSVLGEASIVLVVAAGGEAGAVFRQSASPTWPVEALPLYEWPAEPKKDGPKPTVLSWRNYHASEPVTRSGSPSPSSLLAPLTERISSPPVLFPDAELEEEARTVIAPPPTTWHKRLVKPAIYVACALGGAVLVAAMSAIISSGDASSTNRASANTDPATVPGTAAYTLAVLDRRADTLALALTAFADRARMFDAHQMACPGLARGLQQTEDNWLSYNIARRETLAPFDAQREERDRTLYADVRAVERRFERSGCARP